MLQMPSERFELSTPGLQDQCSNHWATKAQPKEVPKEYDDDGWRQH